MLSYNNLPSDVEKYCLSPYLSCSDIASLSCVNRKARDTYDITYWEKRIKDEEGVRLFDYGDNASPYVRYSRTKKYLEAGRQFTEDTKTLSGYLDSSEEDEELRKNILSSLYFAFDIMKKYEVP